MLKPLTTTFKGREITLECTHKREFPPPQMYGSTPDDIDTLWKQGRIDQNQYQHLKVWHEKCGLMVMGPRCLDCPLALKQNPRPGRPHVIETENWLEVKNKMHWDDMKAGKLVPEEGADAETPTEAPPEAPTEAPIEGAPFVGEHDEDYPVPPKVEQEETPTVPSTEESGDAPAEGDAEEAPSSIADILSEDAGGESDDESDEDTGADLDDDIISALADD